MPPKRVLILRNIAKSKMKHGSYATLIHVLALSIFATRVTGFYLPGVNAVSYPDDSLVEVKVATQFKSLPVASLMI